jgi:hypothetical protein
MGLFHPPDHLFFDCTRFWRAIQERLQRDFGLARFFVPEGKGSQRRRKGCEGRKVLLHSLYVFCGEGSFLLLVKRKAFEMD